MVLPNDAVQALFQRLFYNPTDTYDLSVKVGLHEVQCHAGRDFRF
jgi:hypothetical protein